MYIPKIYIETLIEVNFVRELVVERGLPFLVTDADYDIANSKMIITMDILSPVIVRT